MVSISEVASPVDKCLVVALLCMVAFDRPADTCFPTVCATVLYLLTCHGPQAEKMTGELEAVPTDKASRIKARKESMTAGDPDSERKGTREGPGRSFGTPSIEARTRMHAHSVMPCRDPCIIRPYGRCTTCI